MNNYNLGNGNKPNPFWDWFWIVSSIIAVVIMVSIARGRFIERQERLDKIEDSISRIESSMAEPR
jgi:hypothetical protein